MLEAGEMAQAQIAWTLGVSEVALDRQKRVKNGARIR